MRKKFPSKYIIRMPEFLKNYVLLDEYNENCDKLNHLDVTEMDLPNIKRIPNNLVSEEDVLNGTVLLVEAKSKNSGSCICAYIRPSLVKKGRMKLWLILKKMKN